MSSNNIPEDRAQLTSSIQDGPHPTTDLVLHIQPSTYEQQSRVIQSLKESSECLMTIHKLYRYTMKSYLPNHKAVPLHRTLSSDIIQSKIQRLTFTLDQPSQNKVALIASLIKQITHYAAELQYLKTAIIQFQDELRTPALRDWHTQCKKICYTHHLRSQKWS